MRCCHLGEDGERGEGREDDDPVIPFILSEIMGRGSRGNTRAPGGNSKSHLKSTLT